MTDLTIPEEGAVIAVPENAALLALKSHRRLHSGEIASSEAALVGYREKLAQYDGYVKDHEDRIRRSQEKIDQIDAALAQLGEK